MELLTDIQTDLMIRFPAAPSKDHELGALSIYKKIVEAQGKQEVDSFLRKDPEEVANAIRVRLANGWAVFEISMSGESAIEDSSSPGSVMSYSGMSGIIIYSKP